MFHPIRPSLALAAAVLLSAAPAFVQAAPGLNQVSLDHATVSFVLPSDDNIGGAAYVSEYNPDYNQGQSLRPEDYAYSTSGNTLSFQFLASLGAHVEIARTAGDFYPLRSFGSLGVGLSVKADAGYVITGYRIHLDATEFDYSPATLSGELFVDQDFRLEGGDLARVSDAGGWLTYTVLGGAAEQDVAVRGAFVADGRTAGVPWNEPASAGIILNGVSIEVLTAPVPEPQAYVLMGLGLAALAFAARRRA